jgi:2-polyprenyl-3-methyl-5-hydroxy-6-metoxy-1,4-benzoquinol methylase
LNKASKAVLEKQIKLLLSEYYEDYYRAQLGLPDWRVRVQDRLSEEKYLGGPNLDRVEDWMGVNFARKRVLVVGAGTGAESVALHQRGAKVYGVEPDVRAINILGLKAQINGIPQNRFRQGVAEHIPHPSDFFDFVYCYTVLEHVQNVEKTIDEMVRVCKVGGLVYIQTPDYRFPYEGHYKSSRISFSSKWLTYLQFWVMGKPVCFLRSVNFVNAPNLDKFFMKRNVLTLRVMPPWLREWHGIKSASSFIRFARRFGFGKDQFIFLRKLPAK